MGGHDPGISLKVHLHIFPMNCQSQPEEPGLLFPESLPCGQLSFVHGQKRVDRTVGTLEIIDLALLVVTDNSWGKYEDELLKKFQDHDLPYIVIHSKSDIQQPNAGFQNKVLLLTGTPLFEFSSVDKRNYEELISLIRNTIPEHSFKTPALLGDLISYGDIVILITPIDIEAPAGRLILPQMQAIRDILDNEAVAIVLKEREVDAFLKKTKIKPALAITDSQVFVKADASIPHDIPLTSFSIMLARFKGDFDNYLKGTPKTVSYTHLTLPTN